MLQRSRGFTLVEALVAMSIMAMVGAVVLLSVEGSLKTADDCVEKTVAEGMAHQLLDEILSQRYMGPGITPYQIPLGPSPSESAGSGRELFNDIDDYHGFQAQVPEDMWGWPVGAGDGAGGLREAPLRAPSNFFAGWRQEVEVYYVSGNDLTTRLADSQASNFRAVEVRITRLAPDGVRHQLARVRRVVSYVPGP